MVKQLNIGVLGHTGRMAQALVKAITDDKDCILSGCLVREKSIQDNFPYPVYDNIADFMTQSDVVIDFTTATALPLHLHYAVKYKKPLVIGTTGFSQDVYESLHKVSQEIPIVQSGNMSLGINLLSALIQKASALLGTDWDAEITEAHHRRKIDAPSGTALLLGEAVAKGRGMALKEVQKLSREGITGIRPEGEIGFSVIRGGGIIGNHDVSFIHEDESITFSHHAQNRKIFANGAVYAAKKLNSLPIGLYDMQDILGLKG